jgi:hypothetical protein
MAITQPPNPELVYLQLGQLVETMPDLTQQPLPPEAFQWLGRAHSLVHLAGDPADAASFKVYMDTLAMHPPMVAHQIASVLHRALARAERAAPAHSQGGFIPAGNAFDALTAVGKVLGTAKRDVLIVDPYMDEKALTDFALLAPEGIPIRLLADRKAHKATLVPAHQRWSAQFGARRPIDVRCAPSGQLHDRVIFLDGVTVWLLSQSLNAFALRSPATITRVFDVNTAELKITAYERIWSAATPL